MKGSTCVEQVNGRDRNRFLRTRCREVSGGVERPLGLWFPRFHDSRPAGTLSFSALESSSASFPFFLNVTRRESGAKQI